MGQETVKRHKQFYIKNQNKSEMQFYSKVLMTLIYLFLLGRVMAQSVAAQSSGSKSLGAHDLVVPEKFTVGGYIRDESNGEELIGATVLVSEISGGGVSNVYGYYAITLPKGNYTLIYRYVGFESITREIVLDQDLRLDIELPIESEVLEAVVVSSKAEDANISTVQMSTASMDIKSIKKNACVCR